MKNTSIKSINIVGLIGYIISIILIIVAIVSMVAVGICTIASFRVANDDINVKVATSINVDSKGNFLEKLDSFIKVDGIEDFGSIIEEGNEDLKIENNHISELKVQKENGEIKVDIKTNEISISMKKIIISLILAFIFLGATTVTLYMVKALMKSLKNCETPFAEDVIKNMSHFANSLVCVLVLSFLFGGYWSSVTSGTYNFNINIVSLLFVAIIYILIIVFKYGAELQKESDETL